MERTCQQCGEILGTRAKANIWNGEWVVCTPCKKTLESVVQRQRVAVEIAGRANEPWLVHDGRQQYGPYSTAELISFFRAGRVDWMWNVWRVGMKKWTPAAQLFVSAELGRGRIELRDHGQGDGTYKPTTPS